MKLVPVITEKTTELAKNRKYTFRVDKGATKPEIKEAVMKLFGIKKIVSIKTIKERGELRRGLSGRKRIIRPSKKAIIETPEKVTIDLFETKKK